jgi:hypothetical protein
MPKIKQTNILLIFTLLFFLQSCHHLPWIEASDTKNCLQQCHNELLSCKEMCLTDCNHCCRYTQMQGRSFYQRYLKRKRIEGKPAFSSLQSFYDPLQCNKNSCSCHTDLLLCEQSCHGKIHKRLKTYKFC